MCCYQLHGKNYIVWLSKGRDFSRRILIAFTFQCKVHHTCKTKIFSIIEKYFIVTSNDITLVHCLIKKDTFETTYILFVNL